MWNNLSCWYLLRIELLIVVCTQPNACIGYIMGVGIYSEVTFSGISLEELNISGLEVSEVLVDATSCRNSLMPWFLGTDMKPSSVDPYL